MLKGVQANLTWRYYDNYYSAFDPFSRNDETDREQVWKIPSYSLFDAHLYYDLPVEMGGVKVSVFAHVFNIFDELYVEDATDNSQYNGLRDPATGEYYEEHSASSAEVYVGLPRNFNAGFRVEF